MCHADKLNTSCNKVRVILSMIQIFPPTSPISDILEEDMHPDISLKDLKAKHEDKVLIGHININILKIKFDVLRTLVQGVDISMNHFQ